MKNNPPLLNKQQFEIAIIAVWFGPLPPYFPAWLLSCRKNEDVTFILLSDQKIEISAPNIRYIQTTLEKEVERAEQTLGERVIVSAAYKFCDVRPFFGIVYQDYLAKYDFWGYCDIDLVFGRIRSFLTDDILQQYDRFYEWGHFSLFRNNDRMNHLYDLPGSLYSRNETLSSPVKVNAEEHHGINRICEKNNIAWYRKKDYADFWICYSDLLLWNGMLNYDYQVFYWESGHAFRTYIDEIGKIQTNEYVYIHWQKRVPVAAAGVFEKEAFFITANELLRKENGVPERNKIIQLSPPVNGRIRKKEHRQYLTQKILQFIKSPWKKKVLWMRQKLEFFRRTGHIAQQ